MIELIVFLEFFKNVIYNKANLFNLHEGSINNNVNKIFKKEDFREIKNLKIDPSKITAKNVLIKEIEGPILYGKNYNEQKPIASLTKLVTALVALNIYNPEEEFEIRDLKIKEAQTSFTKGEKFLLKDLLKAMLISSSNASANIIASKVGEEKFINYMNNLAKNLNLLNTKFEDNTGLSSRNISSLLDLYYISKYILKEKPEIFEYSRNASFLLKGNFIRNLYNTNKLVEKYSKFILGSKTGFTDEAGECLLMILKFENSPLIFVGILDSKNRELDGEYIIKTLMEYYK